MIYQTRARILSEPHSAVAINEGEAARRMMTVLRDEFVKSNPRFNAERFVAACGGHAFTPRS